MTDKLNVKQEKFIQGIVRGLSQRQAYKEAYEVNYEDKAIDENACKLFNSTKIQQRYKELLEELEDKTIMTAKERMKWLTDIIMHPNKAVVSDRLRAVEILNKMTGEYITKIDANVGVSYEDYIKKVEAENEY